MRNRIILILLVLGGIAGIIAVIWYILVPVLPTSIAPQPPASTQQPSERPFNPTPPIPQAPTTTSQVDANSPAERERQAQEAIKRAALDLAARINTYSNADDFEALRQAQTYVGGQMLSDITSLRDQLRKDKPSFGVSWGVTMSPLSATLTSKPPYLNAAQATLNVQAQKTVESFGKPDEVSQVSIDITLEKNGAGWIVTKQSIQPVE